MRSNHTFRARSVIIAAFTLLIFGSAWALAPSVVNYQGYLTDSGGAPLDTTVQMIFSIYHEDEGGTAVWDETHTAVTVSDGRLDVLLGISEPFSPGIFNEETMYLGVTVGEDTEMSPRTRFAAVPYAYRVATVDKATGGIITGDVLVEGKGNFGDGNTNVGVYAFAAGAENNADGDYSVIAGGQSNYTAGENSAILSGTENTATEDYAIVLGGSNNIASGYAGLVGGGYDNDCLGNAAAVIGGEGNHATGENAAVVNGNLNSASSINSFIGGGEQNQATNHGTGILAGNGNIASGIASSVGGGGCNRARGDYTVVAGGGGDDLADSCSAIGICATVGGGLNDVAKGFYSFVGGGAYNYAIGNSSAIVGGNRNRARGEFAFVGGGGGETLADSNAANGQYSTVTGGNRNRATGLASFIGGGRNNRAQGEYSVVCGGGGELADSGNVCTGMNSFIGGGTGNRIDSTIAIYDVVAGGDNNTAASVAATVPGGADNHAYASFSFAAGHHACANNAGAFVWADNSTSSTFFSSAQNQFNARAAGGIRLYTNSGLTSGMTMAAGGSGWVAVSDSTKKQNIRLVDTETVLDRIAQLPIKQWSYKAQDPSIEHVGPMAQDFWNLFHLGEDSLGINQIDPDGIALAAIQELNKKVQEIDGLKQELAALRAQVQTLMAGETKTLKEDN
jgi:hypothetical protein